MNYEVGEKKDVKNNVPAMRQKLAEMQSKLNWVERLDLVNGPAPLAPELAYKEELHSKERASRAKQAGGSLEEDVVHNDFKREMLFYRHKDDPVQNIPSLKKFVNHKNDQIFVYTEEGRKSYTTTLKGINLKTKEKGNLPDEGCV